MAIKSETLLYEILIRFGPEGLRGAHVKDLERVFETGKNARVISEQEVNCRPITVEEIGELLGKKQAAFVETAIGHKARTEAAEAATEQALLRIAELETEVLEARELLEKTGAALAETEQLAAREHAARVALEEKLGRIAAVAAA